MAFTNDTDILDELHETFGDGFSVGSYSDIHRPMVDVDGFEVDIDIDADGTDAELFEEFLDRYDLDPDEFYVADDIVAAFGDDELSKY